MKTKKVAVTVGVLFGLSASIFAMMPTAHNSEAAVLVMDEKNIQQAVEMVLRTQNILNKEEQQLVLAMLNNKKIDSNTLLSYLQKTSKQSQYPLNEKMGSIGLDKGTTGKDGTSAVWQAWNQRLGSLQDVLNGKTTIAGAVMDEMKREQTLNDTYKQAAISAENTQTASQEIATTTNQLLNDSMNVEGTLQALQVGNNINAQTVFALLQLNQQVSRQVQAEAAYYQNQNLIRARQIQADEEITKKARAAAGLE